MTIAKAYYHSPLGILILSATHQGLASISWAKNHHEESIPPLLEDSVNQLREYFDGKRSSFDIKLDWSNAAEFDKKVWKELLKIPYGKTVSYSNIAVALGDIKAVRAVGGANGRNPIPIVVPCHRVIGKNGDLVGFTGGLDRKWNLLQIERPLEFGQQGNLFQ